MANITFDPVVEGISKGLGNFVYSVTKSGKSYIRKRPRKAAWITPEQTAHRQIFRSVAKSWKPLSDAVRKSWEKFRSADGITEYTVFMSENMTHLKKGEPMNLTHGTGLAAPAVSAASDTAGEVALTYTAGTEPLLLNVYIQAKDEAGNIGLSPAKTDVAGTSCTITGLASGADVTLYCVFADKPMAETQNISASQGVHVTVQ